MSFDLLGWCRYHQVEEGNFIFIIAAAGRYFTHEQVPTGRWIRRTFGRTLIQVPADTPKREDLVTRMQNYDNSTCGLNLLFSGYTAASHKRLGFLATNTYVVSKGPQTPSPPTQKKSRRHLNIPRQKRDKQHVLY